MSLGKERDSNLFRKLITLRDKNKDNIATDTLNEWMDQGNDINKRRLIGIVNELRKYRKYNRAIQTNGVDKAEMYFKSLPGNAKNELTYGALLHCYCKGNMLNEATMLLEKMRELDYASSTLVYNNIMSLLVGVGEPGSVPVVIKEMKSLSDKANLALKEVENMDKLRNRKAYHLLLTMYSSVSNKLGVYRVWESLKLNFPETTNNGSYLVMLQALSTLWVTQKN
ncbi:hypothetical protein IFM89_009580 [Coptis chinensis]|uniref:Pentatricopeptide repeat-containing protein n=1 Tax=Coptis chinensis TaxID=261450 RepID=A0A835IMC4_9MAGN|nr:hypothetical protein IFM89_009580 [Coptis chinensis]